MSDTPEFIARKAIGASAELALKDLLTSAGGIVTLNQRNHDITSPMAGAAVAHAGDSTLHLPDLSVLFPSRLTARRMHIEAKAKSPLRKGGWGWDRHAYERAFRWSVLTGDPVLYAVRDLTVPLPAPGQADDPDHWCFASVWKLMHAPTRMDSGDFLYWGASEFLPLGVLLEGIYTATLLPVIWLKDGPPIIL